MILCENLPLVGRMEDKFPVPQQLHQQEVLGFGVQNAARMTPSHLTSHCEIS